MYYIIYYIILYLYYIILCYVILCYLILYNTVLYYIHIILYYIYIILYYINIIAYYILLYYVVCYIRNAGGASGTTRALAEPEEPKREDTIVRDHIEAQREKRTCSLTYRDIQRKLHKETRVRFSQNRLKYREHRRDKFVFSLYIELFLFVLNMCFLCVGVYMSDIEENTKINTYIYIYI